MHAYARGLKAHLTRHANPRQAVPMKRYMRDQFEYLGIKLPMLYKLLRQYQMERGLPELTGLDQIVRDLWALPQREFQYAATWLLERRETELPAGFVRTL
jgi:3-methyladenine DNA glycosylase AlkD